MPGALEDIQAAIKRRPDHALSYISRGLLRGKSGDAAGLRADFAHAGRLDPSLIS